MKNQVRKEKSLVENLINIVKNSFKKISEPLRSDNRGRKQSFTIVDCLLAGLAMFGIKSSSLFQFDNGARFDSGLVKNLKTLYELVKVPSDTQLRERLDWLNPKELKKTFRVICNFLQKKRILNGYKFRGEYILLSVDGTGIFSSEMVYCCNCCKKISKGKEVNYHQVVSGVIIHPDKKEVFPIGMEPVCGQNEKAKNDCERNAAKRFLRDVKRDHPEKDFIIILDALYANAPFIQELEELGMKYIISVRPGSNRNIFEWIDEAELSEYEVCKDGIRHRYKFENKIPLLSKLEKPEVNFFECFASGKRGGKHFTWITNIEINLENVEDLTKAGRARWKIENETFNTLKNQGYQFEHNFGHGHKNLCNVFGNLMFLAFLIDQIQQHCCALFQAALKEKKYRKYLWEKMRMLFCDFCINSWEDLYLAIAKDHIRPDLEPCDTS